jgi:hypothetical protein
LQFLRQPDSVFQTCHGFAVNFSDSIASSDTIAFAKSSTLAVCELFRNLAMRKIYLSEKAVQLLTVVLHQLTDVEPINNDIL